MKHSNLKLLLLVALPGLAFADYPNLYLSFCNHTTEPIEVGEGSFTAPGYGNWWFSDKKNEAINFTLPAANPGGFSCTLPVKMTHTGGNGGTNYFKILTEKYDFSLGVHYTSLPASCNVYFYRSGKTGQGSGEVDPPNNSRTECNHSVDFY